ncbi:dipeptide epimerase [Govanella unica]|uniref:Dipeptide epimerase n=1 Tax=Govanella unica TaxID=2975056 RepID=A0A9X3Z8F4_9PROT|nr:dipeptide epimerase [Govania unica]MDA5195137.1 dipeptide epimerase [Govania unica]
MIGITLKTLSWSLSEPFKISRGEITHVEAAYLELRGPGGVIAHGEACGINYEGETPDSIITAVSAIQDDIQKGLTRQDLLDLLPVGGARNLVDAALWDYEAKTSGQPAWKLAGLSSFETVVCAQTIGIRDVKGYADRARSLRDFPLLKIKVGGDGDDMAILEAVHNAAPNSKLIVDPNQSWTMDHLTDYAARLHGLGVVLLEQPLPVDGDAELEGLRYSIPICADESIHDRSELMALRGKYDAINIKLDKTGGLTEALALARDAQQAGFQLMVGCMAGSSLAMAPGAIIAQLCGFVDLDGPLLQSTDWEHAIDYDSGYMMPVPRVLWG